MITFSKWSDTYNYLIPLLSMSETDPAIFSLLHTFNDQFLFFSKLSWDLEKRIAVLEQLIHIINELLKADVPEISIVFGTIQVDALKTKQKYQNELLTKTIENAIDAENIDGARELLGSEQVTQKIKNHLLHQYCHSYKGDSYSIKNERNVLNAINLLYEVNADFNCYDKEGQTPLMIAVTYQKYQSIIRALVHAGADVNMQTNDNKGITPLHLAASTKGIFFIKLLLEYGADLQTTPNLLNYILTEDNYDFEIIALLIKNKLLLDSLDSRGFSSLKNAVLLGRIECVDLLLSSGACLYDDILIDAIKSGEIGLVNKLVQDYKVALVKDIPHFEYLDTTYPGIDLNMFKFCLSMGMSLDKYSLRDEVVLRTPEAAEFCFNRNGKLDYVFKSLPIRNSLISKSSLGKGCSLIHFAAACAAPQTFSRLIAAGLHVHARDAQGRTPLHYAAALTNEEAVKILILAGADVNAVDSRGRAPLHLAVATGRQNSISNKRCAESLIYAGANPNLKDNQKKTPLRHVYMYKERFHWFHSWDIVLRMKYTKAATIQEEKVPPLAELTTFFITRTKMLTQNLVYRKTVSEDMALKIEKVAMLELTPK